MYIYDLTDNHYHFPILDPDFIYHHQSREQNLYPFFKQLTIPQKVRFITGIYIEYRLIPYRYEEYPQIYFHISQHLMEKLKKYFDFGDVNLYYERSNFFFMVMFNTDEKAICDAFIELYHYLQKHSFDYQGHICSFSIKCGLYVSNISIHPYKLFDLAQEQCHQILAKEKSFISIHNLMLLK